MPLKVFVSYSHKDAAHQQRLDVHLAPLVRNGLQIFYDGRITPGADLDAEIRRELREASVFVALASADYLKSEYCFVKEYGYARRRAARKTMFVVAVILRPCGWKATRMARYKSLPRDGREVTLWPNRDAAYEDVVGGLRRVIAEAAAAEGQVARRSVPNKRAKVRAKRIAPEVAVEARARTAKPMPKPRAAATKVTAAPARPSAPKASASRLQARSALKPGRRTRPKAG